MSDVTARLGASLDPGEIRRAARVLWVRSRRQATSWFVGGYTSAFRGGGSEFEESRPYVPGDDVRAIDWNATARTGEPWVKRFREERSQSVLLALDVSASMGFGTTGRKKVEVAAQTGALLAAAAGTAGDRIGLVTFSERVIDFVPPGRGDSHTWRVIRMAAEALQHCGGRTDLESAVHWIRRHARRRAIVVVLSDFRDDEGPAPASRDPLARLGERHDLVAAVVEDPREQRLVAAGAARLSDPERPGRHLVLGTRRARRQRYAAAADERRRLLERRLRASGADLLRISTASDPLSALSHFLRRHGGLRHRGPAA